jgi:hypothetical protein
MYRISAVLLIILTGCMLTNSTPKETSIKLPEVTQTDSISVTSSLTFTPTMTQIPTKTSTNIPSPTRTPIPTFEPTAAVLYVERLLQNNNGCQLRFF